MRMRPPRLAALAYYLASRDSFVLIFSLAAASYSTRACLSAVASSRACTPPQVFRMSSADVSDVEEAG